MSIRHLPLFLAMLCSVKPAVAEVTPDLQALLGHQLKRLHASEVVDLQQRYAGKPLLIVNTASHCGYTGQFEGLEALYRQYHGRGLMMAGFPSHSFRQEASDEAKTAEVCFVNFGVSFDMYAPIAVRGKGAHPIFQELARQSQAPRWNFYKYLIDREGRVVGVFPSKTRPDAPELRAVIERQLQADSATH